MIINARALELLLYLTEYDIKFGKKHTKRGFSIKLQKYIHEFTSGMPIHIPKCLFGGLPLLWYNLYIEELETLRKGASE